LKKALFIFAVLAATSGCDRVGNAWNALTDSDQPPAASNANGAVPAPSAATQSATAAIDAAPSAQKRQTDDPPFSVEEFSIVSGNRLLNFLRIRAATDNLTIDGITANRGNCKLIEPNHFPVTLKFGETTEATFMDNCYGAENILEMKVDTTVGSWTWTR
jgi:hypothetical protein